jgi:hypothetical protein
MAAEYTPKVKQVFKYYDGEKSLFRGRTGRLGHQPRHTAVSAATGGSVFEASKRAPKELKRPAFFAGLFASC